MVVFKITLMCFYYGTTAVGQFYTHYTYNMLPHSADAHSGAVFTFCLKKVIKKNHFSVSCSFQFTLLETLA